MEAARKWRTPDTPIACVYPSASEWKEGLMISKIHNADIMEDTMQIHAANKVQGKDKEGNLITWYFLRTNDLKIFHKKLEKLWSLVNDVPFFPVPIFGISSRLERTSLSKLELKQASALYRTELEAYLLEIWSHICPTMSALIFIFRRNWDQIWKMRMDLWKDDNTTPLTHHDDTPSISYLWESPPHIAQRNPRKTMAVLPEVSTIEEEDKDQYNWSDSQNLHASITARHVGTQSSRTQEPDLHLGRGRLWESIQGSQYFHGYSKPLTDPTANFHPSAKAALPPLDADDFISISCLPQSNQGSQDGEAPQEWWTSRGRLIPNDPNDPDDDDDDEPPRRGLPQGPPRGPPGDLPQGNNAWMPRRPGGPPAGGPPGGPPGGPGGPFPQQPQPNCLPVNAQGANNGFRFEKKIKISDIPEWDGNGDTILDWLDEINHIAYRNPNIYYI